MQRKRGTNREPHQCVPRIPFCKTSGTHTLKEIQSTEIRHYTYIFQAACGRHGISNGRAGPDGNTHLSFSSKTPKINIHGYEIVATNVKKGDHTTRLTPSSFRPVSFRNATIKGHTPTILATTSTSSGIARLLVKMAFFSAGREAIQSRLSAPFNLFTLNSVMEYGSRVPKTLDAFFWRQRLKRRKSNNGYSINFCWYPLPKKFTYASTRAWGPLAQTPHEHLDQLRQWYAPAQPPPRSRFHWTDPVLPRTPDGIDCCPSNEVTPRCAQPAPQIGLGNSHATVPRRRPSSKIAGTYRWGWLTKSKTTMKDRDECPDCDKESH